MTTLRTDSTHSGITIDYANGSGFVHGGSGPLTVYSDDEKAAINALTGTDDDTYYLFLVKNVTKLDADGNNTVVSGYMPVGYQHGFIFEQFNVVRTYAHELSHGAFALHHTFSENSESFHANEGTTNNLMDYAEGATLNYKQWSWMHEKHGSGLFGFLADEEESEIIIDRYKFTYNVTEQLAKAQMTNDYFVVDNNGTINLFSNALVQKINSKLKSVNDNGQQVYVITDLFTCTETKDVDQVKIDVDKQVQALRETNDNIVVIVAIGYKLVNANNLPLQETPDLLIRAESFKNQESTAAYKEWEIIGQTNEAQVESFIDDLIPILLSNPLLDRSDCLDLTYAELGISSALEINPNDVKEWVSAFAGDNDLTIDYSYTGYPAVNNKEIPTISLNQPENSNADINIAVHFDENDKKITICHNYKIGAIAIPTVTALNEPVQGTTVDEILGLSKTYAEKALNNATSSGEKKQTLFNSAVKCIVAAKTWTKTICEKMEVPQAVWNDMDNKDAYDRSPVHVEPILSGVGDGTFEELKSIPELITLALDVAFDKDIRASLWNSIKSISWEDVKNFPVKMAKDKIAVYQRGGAIAKHEGGRDAVQIASMMLGFGGLSKGKEVAEEVGEKFGKEIADVLKKMPDALKNKLDDFDPAKFKKIISDLKDEDLLRKFNEKPELVDAWEVIENNPTLRKNISNLENIGKWLKEDFDKQKITDAIAKSKNKQKLIEDLGLAKSKVHAQILIKDYDNIPGVVKGRYKPNGSKLIDKIALPKNWSSEFDLPESHIENFTGTIEPLELKKGDRIYRVSNKDGVNGVYWTRTKPQQLDDVIGGTAVLPEWNNFEYIHEYIIPDGVTIKCWKGRTSSQPVSYNSDGTPLPSNYYLPGGDEQLFIGHIEKQDINFGINVKTEKTTW